MHAQWVAAGSLAIDERPVPDNHQALNLEGSFTGTYTDANYGAHSYVRYANGKFAEFTAARSLDLRLGIKPTKP